MMGYRLRTLLTVGLVATVTLIAIAVGVLVLSRPTYLSGPMGIVKGQPGEVPKHGFIGVGVESPDAPLIIKSVLPGSGAAGAGLQPSDIILSIGDESDPDLTSMKRVAESASPGDEIPLIIRRESKEIQLTVRLMSFWEMAQLQANAMKEADLKRAQQSNQ